MNRNTFWKWLVVVIVVAWAIHELYPPTGQNLVQVFEQEAINKDETFQQILQTARQLEEQYPRRDFANLQEAIGTNEIAKYFPYNVSTETDPTLAVLHKLQQEAAGQIRLGLDLQGGTSFLVSLDTSQLDPDRDKDAAIQQAINVIRKRVDKMGVSEPQIQPAGEDRVLIQLPGLSEEAMNSARQRIQQAAHLELRLVHENSAQLIAENMPEPGYEKLSTTIVDNEGQTNVVSYMVRKKPELTGETIERAYVSRDPYTTEPKVLFNLNPEGAQKFARVTRENVERQLAIVLDGELYSAPVIQTPITDGRGSISGQFSIKEAFDLANVLENPLEAPLQIESERVVDPTLGRDTIQSGVNAAIIGMTAVAVFMVIYYFFAGLVAVLVLGLNLVILMGVLCSLDATLTLPGIAGIVLTIGMAVDANVLIFERLREEIRAGKSLKGAISAAYDKAFGTIFDANLTTLIASVILIYMGTGPVKGFGVTLTIGIAASMFTALYVSRLIFNAVVQRGWLKSIRMLQIISKPNLDFMKYWKPAFAASWVLILIGIGYGISQGSDSLGIDFKGGDIQTLGYAQEIPVEDLRQTVSGIPDVGDPQIQYQTSIATGEKSLQITTDFGTADRVFEILTQTYSEAQFDQRLVDKVGPTIGAEIQRTAIEATLLALFGILVYVAFRYEFSFALGAVIATVHDILMTLGIFFLAGGQMNAPIVAAVLTIIGFSMNDTIVIFDRVREDLRLGLRGSFKELMNQALNQTLSRTIITSGTTLLATLSLWLFGGGAINDFAFTFLVGIITGTYSSIYIASAFVLWYTKGERPKTHTAVVMEPAVEAKAG